MTKKYIAVLIMGLTASLVNAQQVDSLSIGKDTTIRQPKINFNDVLRKMDDRKKTARSFIIPGALIVYGFISLGSDGLKDINEEVQEDAWTEHPHKYIHIDNFLQFAPALSVYALNAAGIHGKNNLRDRSMILLLSNLVSNGFVFSLKKVTHLLRPDGSSYTSFPSGHTTEAFASAEFLRQEYKDVSPWYGVAGYATAAATGYLRMYNNKHWLSDVIAGAGFGIASTKIAYWIYPKIKKWLFRDKLPNTAIMPTWQNHSAGLSLIHQF
jgi:PAP2 superfamily